MVCYMCDIIILYSVLSGNRQKHGATHIKHAILPGFFQVQPFLTDSNQTKEITVTFTIVDIEATFCS